MGSKFVEGRSMEFSKSYEESSPSTPIFFILSPGVDPLKDVEALGKCSHKRCPQKRVCVRHWSLGDVHQNHSETSPCPQKDDCYENHRKWQVWAEGQQVEAGAHVRWAAAMDAAWWVLGRID